MKRVSKRVLACILIAAMLMSSAAFIAGAATFPQSTMSTILSGISSKYSKELSAKIEDLIYSSDYSDIVSDRTTLRNYYTKNAKSWPISNADYFGTSVTDRGNVVNWGWNSAGCMAYACFFTYSVYGSIGSEMEGVKLNAANKSEVINYFNNNIQPGEHIRIYQWAQNDKGEWYKSGIHSIIFLDFGSENGQDGFYFAEYWGGGIYNANSESWEFSVAQDQYNIAFKSFDQYIADNSGVEMFVYNNFESSEFATQESNETNAATISRSIVMALDVSGSMSGSKIRDTKTAAKSFVKSVFETTTNTEIALVTFASNAKLRCTFTKDESTLDQAIDSLSAGGNTNIYEAFTIADGLLEQSSSTKKSVILLSDGEPCAGTYSTSGYRDLLDGTGTFYVDKYGASIYDLCKSYREDKGYYIYTLGFGLSTNSNGYRLLQNIVTLGDNKFVSVANNAEADALTVAFDLIGQNMTTNKKIHINLDCPIDIRLEYNGEVLESAGYVNGEKVTKSFGVMTVETNAAGERCITLDLDYSNDYKLQIIGNGNGTMDMRVVYENGDTSTFREYKNVDITPTTRILSSMFDYRSDLALYVDRNNDGTIDSGWIAGVNKTATKPSEEILDQLIPSSEATPLGQSTDEPQGKTFLQRLLIFFVNILNGLFRVVLLPVNIILLLLGGGGPRR